MKSKQTMKKKKVLIYMSVFLFIVVLAFLAYCKFQTLHKFLNVFSDQAQQKEMMSSKEIEQQIFLENNKKQIEKLKTIQQKLAQSIVELGVTRREFNQKLQNVIALFQKYDEEELWENWQEFQKEFIYEYEKMNTKTEFPSDLPKNTREAEQKIIQILQELNQIIQSMHK